MNDDRRDGRAAGRGADRHDRTGRGRGSGRGGTGKAARSGGPRAGSSRAGGPRDGTRDGGTRDGAGRDRASRRPDGAGRPDRGGRADKAEKAGRGAKAYKAEKAGRTGKAGRGEGGGRGAADRTRGSATHRRAESPSRPEPWAREPVTGTVPAGEPEIPADVAADQLDPSVRAELRTLPRELAGRVARHLAAAEQASDPDIAYEHSVAARRLASRVGVVREVCGVAAYLAGRWADALSELRAARRLTGRAGYTAIMADCERALGRYDRALALVTGPDAEPADRGEEVELRIVESGIRRDMGAADAAVVLLQLPELTDGKIRPWSARLYYAYADALLGVGRADDARDWFARAAAADTMGETDAAERFDELDDIAIEDLEDAEDLHDADDAP